MRTNKRLALSTGATLMLATLACGDGMTDRERGREIVEERFAAAAPAIGEAAPDVTVLDANGREHQLRAILKGNYSVLILGCLT